MKLPKALFLAPVIVLSALLFHSDTALADTCTASATGNWNTAGTWTCDTAPTNHVPLTTDDVVVTSAVATTITVDTAAVANSVSVTNTAVAGTQNVILAVGGNSLTLTTGGLTITGAAAGARNAQLTISTGTITAPGNISFNNTRAQFISTGAGTTNVGGNFGSGGTLSTTATGTINFNGTALQSIGAYTTYNNVTITNASGGADIGGISTTFGGTTTVNGILSISGTAGTKTFSDIVVNGTWLNSANEAVTVTGNVTVNTGATFTSGTAAYTLSGTGKTIGGTITALTIASAAITGTITNTILTPGLTIATTLSGAGTLTQGTNSVLNIGGTSAITTLDASTSTNEVHYTSTAANQTIKAPLTAYHHLFIEKTGRTGTLAAATTVNGNLTVTAGTLADGGFQLTGNGTGTMTMAAGTTLTLGSGAAATSFPSAFTAGNTALNTTSTVNYNATAAQTISDVPTYGNLTLTGAAATKTAAGAITVGGNLTNATASGILADGGFTITVKGNSTMTGTHTGTGKILFSGGSASHSVTGTGYHNVELDDTNGSLLSGTTTIGGTLVVTSGTWGTGTVTSIVNGATTVNGTLLISSTTGAKTFNDLTIASGGVMNFTATENILMGNATGLGGNLTINGTGALTGTSGTWTFSKVGGGAIGGTASQITIPGAATFTTTYTLPATFTVSGTMTVGTGVTELNTGTVTINGTLAGAGTFTQGAGTALEVRSITITTLDATAAGNSVLLTGGAGGTIKGTTYVDLAVDKGTFTATASGTVDVQGDLTVTSGVLNLASSIFTVHGTTDIFGTVSDTSGGPLGGSTDLEGLVTIHTGGVWTATIGEVCDFHFRNGLVMDGASFTSASGTYYFQSNNQSISGTSNLTIDNISVTGIQLTNSSSAVVTANESLDGTGEFIQDLGAELTIASTSGIATLTASAAGNTVNYEGSIAQTVHAGTYQTLTVNGNTSGTVNITSDTTANTALTLGTTILTTGSVHMIMGPGATVSRTSGYINGNLQKNVPTGSPTRTFEIGSGADYTPVDLNFTAVTIAGDVLVNTTIGDHGSIATSDIIASRSVNRFYTVSNSGVGFGSYSATFTFVPADIDSGATPADFILAKFDSSTWSYPTVGAVTATTLLATGMTSLSDFQIGETLAVPPTPTPTPTPVPDGGGGSGSSGSGFFVSPQIVVTVLAAPAELVSGPGPVSYTFLVSTVAGRPPLTDVSVSDTGCGQVVFQTGDSNGNTILESGENWTFICSRTVATTTTSTVTARGVAFGIPASDTAFITVTVSSIGFPETGPIQPSPFLPPSAGSHPTEGPEFPDAGTDLSASSSPLVTVSPEIVVASPVPSPTVESPVAKRSPWRYPAALAILLFIAWILYRLLFLRARNT